MLIYIHLGNIHDKIYNICVHKNSRFDQCATPVVTHIVIIILSDTTTTRRTSAIISILPRGYTGIIYLCIGILLLKF